MRSKAFVAFCLSSPVNTIICSFKMSITVTQGVNKNFACSWMEKFQFVNRGSTEVDVISEVLCYNKSYFYISQTNDFMF